MRQANVSQLEWSQVNLDLLHAVIPPEKRRNGRPHPVPLNEAAVEIIKRKVDQHPTHVFTFRGKPVTQVCTKAWRDALVRAGIDNFRWHDLRHYSESRNMPSSAGKALVAGGIERVPRCSSSAYCGASQSLEEGHQLIPGVESSDSTLARFDLVESRLLDIEIRVKIDLCRLDRLVAEPQRDHAAFRARLQTREA